MTRQILVNALQRRTEQLRALDRKYWRVIGEGPIGDKAQELRDKTWAIQAAGFEPIPRTVLSMGFFENFRRRTGIEGALKRRASKEEIEDRIWDTRFSSQQLETISRLSKTFETPMVVRSSAFGDSRGTGIYESIFYNGNGSLENKIKYVLLSEFSEKAIEYRRAKGIEPGMAVIIEPVFGQWHEPTLLDSEEKLFGPLYSGVAHSNSANGRATGLVCAGLPLLAVQGKGIPLTDKSMSIAHAIEDNDRRLEEMIRRDEICPAVATLYNGMFFEEKYDVALENGVPKNNTIMKNLKWLFDKLRKLEQLLGRPQYVEWAVLEKRAGQQVASLQIADLNIETDFYELTDSEKVFIRSEYVVGKAKKECGMVVEVPPNLDGLGDLRRFNAEHRDYLVIYPGNLTSVTGGMDFSHISNAAVLAERKYSLRDRRPEDHFGGLLQQTGKTLLVIRRADTLMEKLGNPVKNERYPTLDIYPVKTTTLGNPRINKAIVKI